MPDNPLTRLQFLRASLLRYYQRTDIIKPIFA